MANKKSKWLENLFGILGILLILLFCFWVIKGIIGDDTNPQNWTINGTWNKVKAILYVVFSFVMIGFGFNCSGQLFDSDDDFLFSRMFHSFWHSLHPILNIFHYICIVLISVLFSIVILQLTDPYLLYNNNSIDSFSVSVITFLFLLAASISLFNGIFYLITILFVWITNTNMANNYPTEVQCPKCKIRPYRVGMYWVCDKCDQGFDTFKHFGKCPKCNHEHKKTVCLSCEEISNHLEFYPER